MTRHSQRAGVGQALTLPAARGSRQLPFNVRVSARIQARREAKLLDGSHVMFTSVDQRIILMVCFASLK